jgi:hypothetical protein
MINLGELLLLHRVGVSVPCRNGKPIGAMYEYGDMCVCCGSYTPEGRMICLGCEKGDIKWEPDRNIPDGPEKKEVDPVIEACLEDIP